MSPTPEAQKKRKARYRRARVRNFIFTVGPARLTGGSISRRHLSKALVVRDVSTASPLWPAAFDGLRIGHVSDFHLGEIVTMERALEAVELLAAQEPDIIACTGDVVDLHHHGADEIFRAMVAVGAPMGAMLVLGNHDELHCPDTVMRLAREAGVTVLHDEAVSISRNGERLVVGGTSWASGAVACARRVDVVCREPVDLLLSHNPKSFLRSSELGIPLTLSGHTHGGQIAMKNRPNANMALTHRHRAGLFEQGPSRLFITTGVGSWFPLRVNCPAEIAMITVGHHAALDDEPLSPDSPSDSPSDGAGKRKRRLGRRRKREV